MRQAWRLFRIAGLLLRGAATLLLRFPWIDPAARATRLTAWAAELIERTGGCLRVHGVPPPAGQGALIVANHVSWLDIHALHAVLPARFIAKADVRRWPLIGWMAEVTGTVFLHRERRTDAGRVNRTMADLLGAGACLALFPEGTTSDGRSLRPFYASLLQPALDAGVSVWPLAIRYLDSADAYNPVPAYHGDMSLFASLRKILAGPGYTVALNFLPPIAVTGQDRRRLAHAAEAAIRAVLAGAAPHTAPETVAHPPT